MMKVGLIQSPKQIQIIEQIQNQKISIVNPKITKDPIKSNQIQNQTKITTQINLKQNNTKILIIRINMKTKIMIDNIKTMTEDSMNTSKINNNIINNMIEILIINIRNKMISNISLKLTIPTNIEIKKIQNSYNIQPM